MVIELHKKSARVSTQFGETEKANWLIPFYRFQLIRRQKHVALAFRNHIMTENWCNVRDQHFSYCCERDSSRFSVSPHPPTQNNHIIGSDCIQFSKTIFVSFVWTASAGNCFLFHSRHRYVSLSLIKCQITEQQTNELQIK